MLNFLVTPLPSNSIYAFLCIILRIRIIHIAISCSTYFLNNCCPTAHLWLTAVYFLRISVFKVDFKTIFPARKAELNFSEDLFLIAMLSLLPLICWRLIGSQDAREFLAQDARSYKPYIMLLFW